MAKSKQNRWTSSGVIYPSYLWENESSSLGGAIYLNSIRPWTAICCR